MICKMYNLMKVVLLPVLLVFIFWACSDDENPLAPYEGSPKMSNILVEEASFEPQITWVGGYVSVLGINKGSRAALDTSLVWLINSDGNELKYPVKFGELPQNAVDITSQYGGTSVSSLSEDETYTFWVMKQEAWQEVSSHNGGNLFADSTLTDQTVNVIGDSIAVSNFAFTNYSQSLDVFINIEDLSTFGRLGVISVESTNSNRPIISWEITQEGIEESAISVIGICEGQQYNPGSTVWEVYSESTVDGQTVYGNENVINAPLNVGDSFPGTRVFVEFDLDGLERNKSYYIWIANDTWDGESRLRFADGYAYATFNTR